MRTDYLNELSRDIVDLNKEARTFQAGVQNRIAHLTKVRDKVNSEIDRLTKLETGLGQIAAENGAEDFRPRVGQPTKPSMTETLKGLDAKLAGELAGELSGMVSETDVK